MTFQDLYEVSFFRQSRKRFHLWKNSSNILKTKFSNIKNVQKYCLFNLPMSNNLDKMIGQK